MRGSVQAPFFQESLLMTKINTIVDSDLPTRTRTINMTLFFLGIGIYSTQIVEKKRRSEKQKKFPINTFAQILAEPTAT